MANEITVLEGNGDNLYELLFLFPIAVPVVVAGANVVPTPSVDLPDMAQGILAQAEKDALDDGTAAFRSVQFRKEPGLSGADLLARVRVIYVAHVAHFDAWYDSVYLHAGTRFDAS